uniref:Uncharacterized protein n=1 Tax=Rhodosorus marinus TaxID=101924 RepID=A0A7S3A1Q3_9RHOD|mmetsp:Transcript_41472/g.163244  ORF Transcript_41472/g.163244 Transcript_41472/m.163244 type:complete len:192 (+) Transcript_41472:448-1023(+)
MSATARRALHRFRSLAEMHPTALTIAGSGISFVAGWWGHRARQEHRQKIDEILDNLQNRIDEARNDELKTTRIFGYSQEDIKTVGMIAIPATILTMVAGALLGYRTAYPMGLAAAKAALPSTERELAKIKQGKRVRRVKHNKKNSQKGSSWRPRELFRKVKELVSGRPRHRSKRRNSQRKGKVMKLAARSS